MNHCLFHCHVMKRGGPKTATPLMISALHGQDSMIRLFIDHGANVNESDEVGNCFFLNKYHTSVVGFAFQH